MSERWERAIADWYERSRTADLEYLDLSSTKVTLPKISNNLDVIHDRQNLASRIHIKDQKLIIEKLVSLEAENKQLRLEVENLTKTVLANQPITKLQVQEIAQQIALQAKQIEEQTVKLSQDLSRKLDRVEGLLHRLEEWTSS